jgi:hypothetical protein
MWFGRTKMANLKKSSVLAASTLIFGLQVQFPAEAGDYVSLPVEPPIVCDRFLLSTQMFKSATWCASSALLPQADNTYRPRNLVTEGAWCEGADGHGIGEAIEVHYQPYENEEPVSFKRLFVANGYDKNPGEFKANSRVKQLVIRTDAGKSWVRTLEDRIGEQVVALGEEISPTAFVVTILDIYPGDKYQDTCLSTLTADFGM